MLYNTFSDPVMRISRSRAVGAGAAAAARIAVLTPWALWLCHCSGSIGLVGDTLDAGDDRAVADELPDIPDGDSDGSGCAGSCDDNNPCTSDECIDGVCVHAPLPDDTPCVAGERCPAQARCSDGLCVPTPLPEEGSILWTRPLEEPDHGTAVLHEPGGDLIVLYRASVERLMQDGSVVWSSPAYLWGNLGQLRSLIAGRVVVTAQYDELVGLDLDSGEELWRVDTGGYIDSAVLAADGLVIAASVSLMSGPFMLSAYVPDSGQPAWGREVDIRITEMAATRDGLIYTSNGGQSDSPGYIIGLEPDGSERFRIDTTNSGPTWISVDAWGAAIVTKPFSRIGPDGVTIYTSSLSTQEEAVVAPDGSVIMVGDNQDACVRRLGPGGEVLSEYPIDDNTLNHPLVDACGIVYLVTYHGTIVALDPGGKRRWSNPAGSDEIVASVPDLSDQGVLYVATFDALYAIQAAGAPLADTSWPRFRADPQATAMARR
jgi:outer membrane protein assembly factor BamB